ncbi:MAG: FG-GAP-like repeat-containing protein [Cyclobacteriaceae bacterium]
MGFKEDFSSILEKKRAQLELIATRINKSKKSGTFYRYSPQKRNSLLFKFKKLTRKVDQLRWQMKLAAVGGTFAALSNTQDAFAQAPIGPFVNQGRASNPLRYPLQGNRLRPAIVDLDNDGDYDIVVGGNSPGGAYYDMKVYENVGTNSNPRFNDHDLVDAGLNFLNLSGQGSPSFADLNGDGLLDLIVGVTGSVDRIQYFVNNGGTTLGDGAEKITFTEQTGSWDNVAKTGNPFYGINSFLPGFDPVPFLIDFDGDGDMDVFIGHDYSNIGDGYQVHYYENDGSNNFTQVSWDQESNIVGYANYSATPVFADIDQDGNLDFIMGRQNGDVRFFKGDAAKNFTEQTGPWDPIAKTGNPFDGIDFGYQSAPAFADLDNDGLNYFINQGNAVFEQQLKLDNPFNGITLFDNSTAYFADMDGDGDLDALLGGKYDGAQYFINENNGFVRGEGIDNPFNDIDFSGDPVKPVLIDIDGDGDLDLLNATYFEDIQFFQNNEGVYELQEVSPFSDINLDFDSTIDFVDIDNDGDFDLFVFADDGTAAFYRNTGDAENPEFEAPTDPTENPLDASYIPELGTLFPYNLLARFVDVDNDGDFDILFGAYYYVDNYTHGDNVYYIENTGSPEAPVFVLHSNPIISDTDYRPYPSLADADGDGDLDIFLGNTYGTFKYFVNNNPAAVPTVSSNVLSYTFGSGAQVLDANLTLADQDNDKIVQATVSIQSFQPGDEVLTFTPQAPVTGSFNTTTGVLTLQGNAPLATYQSILRTVAYEYTGADPGARKGSAGKIKALSRTIAFAVIDADKTIGQSASRTVNVASQPKNPPVITVSTLKVAINNSTSINLNTIISDPDGNLDPLGLSVIPNVAPTPARVGKTFIANGVLAIDYADTNFVGTDFVTIQACDLDGLCAAAELSIEVAGGIIVHNGMSPNGDGLNDYFDIANIALLGAENKVSIFNRWGDKVFEVNNYDNASRRFEGKSDGGKELSSGVYFYKIEFLNGQPELTGYLTIKR